MSDHNIYNHVPVLLQESVDALIHNPNGIYIDVTVGGGGHSREILSRLKSKAKLFGMDQDEEVIQNLDFDNRYTFIAANFRYIKKYMDYYQVEKVDGVLADLGVSSYHFDEEKRGFSFHSLDPLDMRMNQEQEKTARDVIMDYSAENLYHIIRDYGEITNAKKVAEGIIQERKNRNWRSCKEFANWAEMFAYGKRNQWMAQLFQAIRIEVNREMDSLQTLLNDATSLLGTGGRMVFISYHSLEDRMVKKHFSREISQDPIYGKREYAFSDWSKHAVVPTDEEIERNPRSRSAKMRIAVKK